MKKNKKELIFATTFGTIGTIGSIANLIFAITNTEISAAIAWGCLVFLFPAYFSMLYILSVKWTQK